jgi:hypothetical protein
LRGRSNGWVWLTYRELADRLGTTQKARADGRSAGGGRDSAETTASPASWSQRTPRAPYAEDGQCADLNAAPARQPDAHAQATIDALHEHVATLKAGIEKLEAQLADQKERTDHALAAADIRASETVAKHETLLAVERARADGAIAAFESLAQRLEAIAEAKRKSWRRWLGLAS